MKKLHLALTAAVTVAAGLLAPLSPSAAATSWNDGFQDQDQIIDCITGGVATGVSANVGWSSPSGEVPQIGEKFYLRGYAGLVGLPCSGKVAVLPEILVPAGVEYVDEDVRWDVYKTGESPVLTTDPLDFDRGVNGGILLAPQGTEAFTLRQGEIVEFQFPVRATRELKGPATQQPQCQSRLDGDAPCPIAQAGDHLQIAFTVGGHGGDRWYVTPFVGLFASNGATPTPTPTPTATPTATPTSTPTSAPDAGGQPGAGRASSTTAATWKVSSSRRGKAVVVVRSSRTPTGAVVVKDNGRTIAKAVLKAGHGGRVTITLPRMRKGPHTLVASYRGSDTVSGSASAKRTIRVR